MVKANLIIEFISNGEYVEVGNLRLKLDGPDSIEVAGWSQFMLLENITESVALRELKEIKVLFDDLIQQSSALREYVSKRAIVYNLYFDDYGKVSILICSEKAGIITGVVKLKRK